MESKVKLVRESLLEPTDKASGIYNYGALLDKQSANVATMVRWKLNVISRVVLLVIHCLDCDSTFENFKVFHDHLLFQCREYLGKNIRGRQLFKIFPLEVKPIIFDGIYYIIGKTRNCFQPPLTFVSNNPNLSLRDQYKSFKQLVGEMLSSTKGYYMGHEGLACWPYNEFIDSTINIFMWRLINYNNQALEWRPFNPRAKAYTMSLLWDTTMYEVVYECASKDMKVLFYDCGFCDYISTFKLEALAHAKEHYQSLNEIKSNTEFNCNNFETYLRRTENYVQPFTVEHLQVKVEEKYLFSWNENFNKMLIKSPWDSTWYNYNEFGFHLQTQVNLVKGLEHVVLTKISVFEKFLECMLELKIKKNIECELYVNEILEKLNKKP